MREEKNHGAEFVFREFIGGMSLRDWFAGQATEQDIREHRGLISHPDPEVLVMTATYTREEARYRYADAMIAARGESCQSCP